MSGDELGHVNYDANDYRIIVVKDGQIMERGTFKELLDADGVFASMWTAHIHALKAPEAPIASGSGYEVDILSTERIVTDSPRAATSSLRPADSIRLPSVHGESVPPAVPAKDNGPVSFPIAGSEEGPASSSALAFPASEGTGAPVPTSLAFPTSDDARSVRSQPQSAIPGHVHSASVTFDMTSTPPRASTPDPVSDKQDPASEGKRKRISSQNFQRIARRVSLSVRKSDGIPMIANIANVLKRDGSSKADSKDKDKTNKEESKGDEAAVRDTDVASATGSGSGPASGAASARNSGEISQQVEKDKEREEKKKKRRSFMQMGNIGSFGSSGST